MIIKRIPTAKHYSFPSITSKKETVFGGCLSHVKHKTTKSISLLTAHGTPGPRIPTYLINKLL